MTHSDMDAILTLHDMYEKNKLETSESMHEN